MSKAVMCDSLEEVRENIDRVDREIVRLLAERGGYVVQAAGFKRSTDEVRAPKRVEEVLSRVEALSRELGASPTVTEGVYRAMISAFIDVELAEHKASR